MAYVPGTTYGGYSRPIFTSDAADWALRPQTSYGEGGPTTTNMWFSPSLNTYTQYDPATGKDAAGQFQRYTPEWYQQTYGNSAWQNAQAQYPGSTNEDWVRRWMEGDATASAQQEASMGFLDKIMTGISSNLNPLTGMLAVMGGALAGGAFGALGGAGELGGAGISGIGDLAGGLSSVDVAGGMVPEFGSLSAYESALGISPNALSGGANAINGIAGDSNTWMSDLLNSGGVPTPGSGGTGGDGGLTRTFIEGGAGGAGGLGGNNPLSLLSRLFGGGSGSGMWGLGNSLTSLLSGLFGTSNARDLEQTATGLRNSTDSMMSVRPQAANELLKLIADPSSIVNVPGYQSGMQAVDRSLAKQGFNPANTRGISGNFLNAQSEYGGKFYNDYMTQMAHLAGAQFNPAAAAALQLQGLEGGIGLMGAGTQGTAAGITGLLRNLPTILSFFGPGE